MKNDYLERLLSSYRYELQSCRTWRFSEKWGFNYRQMSHLLIWYVREGAIMVDREGGRDRVSANQIYLLPQGMTHRAYLAGKPPLVMTSLHFFGFHPLAYALTDSVSLFPVDCPFPEYWKRSLDRLSRCTEAGGSSESYIDKLIFSLLLTLAPQMTVKRADRDYDKRVVSVINRIRKDYPRELSAADLAWQVNLSESRLRTLFKKDTGLTPGQFLIKYRMERACRMLLGSAKPASQIARECGFLNRMYFHQQFKKRYGVSPARYRDSAGY